MTTIKTVKIEKTSDIVFNELQKQGFSKYFNWIDYAYFKKLAKREQLRKTELAERITSYFLSYHNELSDFADYEF